MATIRFKPVGKLIQLGDFGNISDDVIIFYIGTEEYEIPVKLVDGELHDIEKLQWEYYPENVINMLCDKIVGELPMVVKIDGKHLYYDKRDKMFHCGCTSFSKSEALQAFKFIGDVLGYTITD